MVQWMSHLPDGGCQGGGLDERFKWIGHKTSGGCQGRVGLEERFGGLVDEPLVQWGRALAEWLSHPVVQWMSH